MLIAMFMQSNRKKRMLAINPRRVDAVQFEREKGIMNGWHREQMEAEAQLR